MRHFTEDQARAVCHSRLMVAGERCITSAASSIERPGEEPEFDDPALPLVHLREAVQRIVQAEQVHVCRRRRGTAMASSRASLHRAAAALFGVLGRA